ncbi:phosphodiesterase [Xanthobacter dioxanivorans]|uniref:Phosphodiesterase n=1 Tax=Xanthobacter dioxanivorans TaxID=2528964 RepID=A0A974PR03_9HYPH|nr:phosphodiesterase [Xanthobacter dioxanivorans]QRG08085.1 phosphodiesterase [Xanthobacter dioxanivorans]
MLIAQLTDTHIRRPGSLAYGVVDTAIFLEAAVAHLLALDPRPDAVIVTGDLTDFDDPQEHARFRQITAALPMPVFPIPGNHDSSAGLLAAFPEIAGRCAGGRVNYVVEDLPLRIVMLDSTVHGRPHGTLGAEGLDFLDRALGAAPGTPALVCAHHPPFLTGIRHMDVQNLFDAAALEAVLRRHPQVLAYTCGHVHRAVTTTFAGLAATIAPAPAHSVSLALDPAAPPTFHMEPPSLSLHRFAEGRLVTHRSFIGAFPGPFPFFGPDGRAIAG